MGIKKQEFYEGAAIHRLVCFGGLKSVSFESPFFLFNGRILSYLKYCTKSRGPWSFTFGTDETKFLLEAKVIVALVVDRFNPELVKNPIQSVSDWQTYRALHLYHFVQLSRFRKVRLEGEQPISDLDTMLLKGEGFLDQLVLAHSSDHKVIWIQLPEGYAFYFPELGSFQFPVEDSGCVTGWTYGYAVPLTPFVAMASVSKTTNEERLWETRNQLSAFSLGLNENVSKALIPPQALAANTDEELCAQIIKLREAAVTTAKAVGEIRNLVNEA